MIVDDSKLANLLSDKSKLTRLFGADGAKKLIRCIISLETAKTLAEYLPPLSGAYRCHQLQGNRDKQFSMSFTKKHRVVFEAVFDGTEDLSDGINWRDVKHVKLLELTDYH